MAVLTIVSTAETYRAFAQGQAAGVSPSYEALALAVAHDQTVLELLATVPEPKRQPNLLLGVRAHLGGPLEPERFLEWAAAQWPTIREQLLARRTQTNEPARCATLLPVLNRLQGPLALLEVGASAGLCLYPDQYRYDYGAGIVGNGPGPVLECRWGRAEPPPSTVPDVVWRAGIDVNPLDLANPEDAAWLQALVWPEQEHRRARLAAATQLVRAAPPLLVAGDLVDDLPRVAASAPSHATLVVFHSAVLAYGDVPVRERFAAAVQALPGHWVANEHPTLLEGIVEPYAAPSPRDGPSPFLVALDGTPMGWAGPHGQSYD